MPVFEIRRSRWKDKALRFRIFSVLLETVSAKCPFSLLNGRIFYLIEDPGAVMDKVNYKAFRSGIFFDERPILLQEINDFKPEVLAGNVDFFEIHNNSKLFILC